MLGRDINAMTDLYGLIGSPVGHSFSPYIHNYLFSRYCIDAAYLAFDISIDNIDNAICGLKALGISGVNVTSPYKETVLKFMDYISDDAAKIGAVNTIKNQQGKMFGYNTDLYGIVKSFEHEGVSLKNKKILMFGAGGVAKTICAALEYLDVDQLIIFNRTIEKAKKLSENIGKKRIKYKYRELNTINVNKEVCDVDIVVNTTNIDILSSNLINFDFSSVKNTTVFFDVIYNPSQTGLLKSAHSFGLRTINGLGMLIFQALKSFEIWTGINADSEYSNLINILENPKTLYKKNREIE